MGSEMCIRDSSSNLRSDKDDKGSHAGGSGRRRRAASRRMGSSGRRNASASPRATRDSSRCFGDPADRGTLRPTPYPGSSIGRYVNLPETSVIDAQGREDLVHDTPVLRKAFAVFIDRLRTSTEHRETENNITKTLRTIAKHSLNSQRGECSRWENAISRLPFSVALLVQLQFGPTIALR